MNKTTIVAFLLLASNLLSANSVLPEINKIESQWANIYYSKSSSEQRSDYPVLLEKTQELAKRHPEATELLIWQAIIIATNAEFENPFTALESLYKAKKLLETVIQTKPNALDGAAFVALGSLYYLSPGWPISFGDHAKAEQLLKNALIINPNSIDANYFYADYLLTKDKNEEATKYFKLALICPTRPDQQYADKQLKKEAHIALKKTKQRKLDSGKTSFYHFFSAKINQAQ